MIEVIRESEGTALTQVSKKNVLFKKLKKISKFAYVIVVINIFIISRLFRK